MDLTLSDFRDFSRFAEAKLSEGPPVPLQNLYNEWNSRREHERSVAAIRQSIAEYESGKAIPLEEAIDEIRRKLERLR